jgi:hypothetical protein
MSRCNLEPKWTVAEDLFGQGRGETGKSVGHVGDVKALVQNAKKQVYCENGGEERRRFFCLSAWLFCRFE